MAPLPDNLTDRYWIDYSGLMGKHSMLFRFIPATPLQDATDRIEEIVTALAGFSYTTTTFYQLRRSVVGTDVSFPVPWVTIAGGAVAAQQPQDYPQFVSWVGRGLDGVRVRFSLIGTNIEADADYRLYSDNTPAVQTVIDALADPVTPLVTASGGQFILNNYANTGFNAYFQRKRRRSG